MILFADIPPDPFPVCARGAAPPLDRLRQWAADRIAPPERCACGSRMVVCECGDDRCPRCEPDGCLGA